jgi:hypothetical protein
MTVEEFAQLVLAQTKARLLASYPDSPQHEWETVNVVPGPKYTKVDIGPEGNRSGKYMVENATGVIYGIKGYGRVHKGHVYGTLDTVGDWYWGGYTGEKVEGVKLGHLSPHARRFITDRAVGKFQGELTAAAPEISRILDEFEQKERRRWQQPAWLHERNNDPYGTPNNHEFWSSPIGCLAERVGDYKIFVTGGFYYAYDVKHNAWLHFDSEKACLERVAKPAIDPWA